METVTMNGLTLLLIPAAGLLLGSEEHALDMIGETYGSAIDAIVVPTSRLKPEFFDLSTKMAGLFIQKLQNYQMRLIVLGDISEAVAASKALKDFVGETNRIGHHYFATDMSALQAQFGRRS